MNDHIPDATKMISDTPRTDAEEYESQDEPITKLGSVDAEFARTLERELIAAQQRIKRLEEAGDKMETRLHLRKNISDQFVYKGDAESVENWNQAKEAKP